MSVITRASGRAAEYAPWALTIYDTCPHGCGYCYVPSTPPIRAHGKTAADFHQPAKARLDLLARLTAYRDRAHSLPAGEVLLLSFMSDPYPETFATPADEITRPVLDLLDDHADVAILTKGGMRAAQDFDIMARNGWWFGQTIIFTDDNLASYPDCDECPMDDEECVTGDQGHCVMGGWEPHAALYADREAALQIAKARGIPTWVSVEPVMNPGQALDVIDRLIPYVDHWKIGKLNGRDDVTREIERSIDWPKFLADVRKLLSSYEEDPMPGRFLRDTFYIKEDLRNAAESQ
ncbi:MAG: hypothetical protein HQ559_13590 [Lentisphaerae bacterium]|nr:hypothetical protein [Lentisphaerota bacterium]